MVTSPTDNRMNSRVLVRIAYMIDVLFILGILFLVSLSGLLHSRTFMSHPESDLVGESSPRTSQRLRRFVRREAW